MATVKAKYSEKEQIVQQFEAALAAARNHIAHDPKRVDAAFDTVYRDGMFLTSYNAESAKVTRANERRARLLSIFARLRRKA